MKKEKTKNLKEIKKELEKFQKLCEENLVGWQRERANFENYRKRMEKRNLELIRFANQELLLKIIPVLDNFDEALNHIPKGWEKTSFIEGIKHISRHLKNILEEEGLSEISIKAGDKFDPCFAEAVEKERVKGKEKKKECKIAEVLQKGYRLNNKVIRPAKVKVY